MREDSVHSKPILAKRTIAKSRITSLGTCFILSVTREKKSSAHDLV